MAFERPTLTELIQRIEADFDARISGAESPLRRSVLKVLARVISATVHLLHGRLSWLAKQLFPDTSEKTNLVRQASLYGITKKDAQKATGTGTATGTDSTGIPSGTILRRSDGEEFETTASATISSGTATLQLQAVDAGVDGNTASGITITMISPIPGVDTTVTVDAPGIIGGIDLETITPLRNRLITRIQNPPHGGTASDYEKWALEVSGVTRAFYYSQPQGLGTVGLAFVMDDKTTLPDFVTNGSFSDGEDLTTNGSFDTDAAWTKGDGWSISIGYAWCDGSQVAASELSQKLSEYIPGRIYRVSYTITRTTGTIKPVLGVNGTSGTVRSASGSYTDEIIAPDKPNQLIFEADASFAGSVAVASVVDMTENDWSLGDGWSINNVSNYAECDGTQTAATNLQQELAQFTVGRKYKVTFTLVRTFGSVTPVLGSASGTARSSSGTYSEVLTAAGANQIILQGDSSFDGSVDNIQVEDETPSLGELALNGDFATDSIWAKGDGWTISSGTASCDGTQTADSLLSQTLSSFVIGRTCKVIFTLSGYSAGNITPVLGASGTEGTARSANGTYTEYIIVPEDKTNLIAFKADSSFIGSIDNVSIGYVSYIIPGSTELKLVKDYIENDKRPVTAELFVTAMETAPIDFTIELKTADTQIIRNAVSNNLEDLIKRESDRSATILLSHIKEAISSATDEVDHVLTAPSADQVASAGQLHVMGTITWV
jgi:uncharacterized phage protein gp47/JayE